MRADPAHRSGRLATVLAIVVTACGTTNGAGGATGELALDARAKPGTVEHGKASYYGRGFAGRKTASGERFDPNGMTAAHRSLPLGTRIRVTRTNGASVTVRVNDRCGCSHGRIVDLSEGAARKLDMIRDGVVPVRLEVLGR